MKIATTLVAVAMVASMAPAASAESTYDKNVDYLFNLAVEHGWPVTPDLWNNVYAAAAQYGDVDIAAIHNGVQVAGVGGTHTGEVWFQCDAFFGGSCGVTNDVPGLPVCAAIPAHWALFIWFGNSLKSTSSASAGAIGSLILWTENHAGLSPLVVSSNGGQFIGSNCISNFGFLLLIQGNGVWIE